MNAGRSLLLLTVVLAVGTAVSGQRAATEPATPVTPLASFGEPAMLPVDRR